MKIRILVPASLFLLQHLSAQVTTEYRQFFSPALSQSRVVVVHKADSCTAGAPCPVIVFLPGYSMSPSNFDLFNAALSGLLTGGQVSPMIVMVPDGSGGVYGRSMYWNSTVNGDFADFIANDLVVWADTEFPVRKIIPGTHDRQSWIIAGFSMGGGGCARIALGFPRTFCGFASFSGDVSHRLFSELFGYVNVYENPDFTYTPPSPSQLYTYVLWGCASAFSPNQTSPTLADFPLEERTGIVVDSVVQRWENADPFSLGREYFVGGGHTADSMSIWLRVGSNDPFLGITNMNLDLHDSLASWGIPHNFSTHQSGHSFDASMAHDLLIWTDSLFRKQTTDVRNLRTIQVPKQYALRQNYPNPFNPSTIVTFTLAAAGHVTIRVVNPLGQTVSVLEDGYFPAGVHQATWNASDVAAGVYFCTMQTAGFVASQKMLLLR